MPWFDDIDPIRPADTEFVSEGAMRFREMKRALIERLSTAYSGFPGENPDRAGELLLFPIVSVMVGTQAERPPIPEREGHGWFSTDTGRLWVGNKDLIWQQVRDPQDATGGPAGNTNIPFIEGITLSYLNWSSGPGVQAFPIYTESIYEPIRQLRTVNMRAFPDDALGNQEYAHGVGSYITYIQGGNTVFYEIAAINSILDGDSRVYRVIIRQTIPSGIPTLVSTEFEVQWSFWRGGPVGNPPDSDSGGGDSYSSYSSYSSYPSYDP